MADYFKAELPPNSKLIGTSNTEWTTGLKHCDLGYIVPDIEDEEEYIKAVFHICKIENVTAILSFYDNDVQVLSKYINEFKKINVTPILPSNFFSNICLDKYETSIFLEKNGLVSPKTYKILNAAIADIKNNKLSFPLILKPRFGFGSSNVFTIYNISQLKTFASYIKEPIIIQEKIIGREYCMDLFFDNNDTLIEVVVKEKFVMRSGEVDHAETVKDNLINETALKLAEAIKYFMTGPLDVDLFVKNNVVYIIELNPRFGGAYPISHVAGANFVKYIIAMLNNKKLKPRIGNYEEGIKVMKEVAIVKNLPSNIINSKTI
ncbi:MAG: ATP-grasp domain-containing protein [Chitinophagales bacterium]|nr:ATP-grasp domain-containing protein [Chitinophagales bacterium]